MITLFNGTFNSTQVLHKAGGIGVELENSPVSFTYDFIDKLITLTTDRELNRNKEKLRKNGCICFETAELGGKSGRYVTKRQFLYIIKIRILI